MPSIKNYFEINAAVVDVYSALSDIIKLSKWWTESTYYEHSVTSIINFVFGA